MSTTTKKRANGSGGNLTVAAQSGTALILAAGESRRFGSDKRFAEVDGIPMLVRTTRLYTQVFDHVAVVLGPDDIALELLEGIDVEVVKAERAREGLSHSVRAGLRTVSDSHWAVIALADMPFVSKPTLQLICSQMQTLSHACIVRPVYLQRHGNPVGVTRAAYGRLLTLAGDVGARELARNEPQLVQELPVKDPGVLRDIDTPEQLATLTVAES